MVDRATQALNPDICSLLGIAVDDMCLQAVYEAADDPAICERLYLEGIRPTCRAYYADPAAGAPATRPRLPLLTWVPYRLPIFEARFRDSSRSPFRESGVYLTAT